MIALRTVLVLAGAGAAVSAFELSATCQQTLIGFAFNTDVAACLNTPYIINNVINSTNAKNDPVGAAKGYLDGMCSSGYCSDATIQAVIKNATTGCAQDIQTMASMGMYFNATVTTDDIKTIETGYQTARNIACLKNTATGNYCAIDGVGAAQAVLNQPASMALAAFMAGTFDPSSLNDAAACTPCAQAAFSIAEQNFPALVDQAKDKVSSVCGASFVDGSNPTTVQQTAVNSSAADLKKTSSHSGASSAAGIQIMSVVAAAILGLCLA